MNLDTISGTKKENSENDKRKSNKEFWIKFFMGKLMLESQLKNILSY
jgi:hypothetical protein